MPELSPNDGDCETMIRAYKPSGGEFCKVCGRKLRYFRMKDGRFDPETGERNYIDVFHCPAYWGILTIWYTLTGVLASHTIVPAIRVNTTKFNPEGAKRCDAWAVELMKVRDQMTIEYPDECGYPRAEVSHAIGALGAIANEMRGGSTIEERLAEIGMRP